MVAAVSCVTLWWALAAGFLAVAALGRNEAAAGRSERGRGLVRYGLGMAALVAAFGVPLTVVVVRSLATSSAAGQPDDRKRRG